ncbi:MAG TPA: hypothetical protein PLO23_05170, partial [Alphaproteobacteria bacterium]|nr:hypothetical protein [Alphaproteobacteria bacterium]
GLALLLIAPLCATDPAALDVLGAVLDTNFWLGTHVLVITSGYGMCILAALLSHLYLWQAREGLFALLYKTSLAALL